MTVFCLTYCDPELDLNLQIGNMFYSCSFITAFITIIYLKVIKAAVFDGCVICHELFLSQVSVYATGFLDFF